MRKSFLLLLFTVVLLSAGAQKSRARAQLSEASVVKDASGNVLSPDQWVPLYQSGKVKVEPLEPSQVHSEFVLSRYTEEEWGKLMKSLPRPEPTRAFRRNGSLAAFDAADLQGNHYKLETLKGKVVVVNFWFINCAPCRLEIPDLNELVEQYKDNKDVVFLGVAMDDPYRLEAFLRQMPFRYHIIGDGKTLAMNNNVKAFPTHVVLDREGKIVFHTDGLALNTVYWLKKSIAEALGQN